MVLQKMWLRGKNMCCMCKTFKNAIELFTSYIKIYLINENCKNLSYLISCFYNVSKII